MKDLRFRNIWIAAGVNMLILIVGGVLFYDNGQAPASAVALFALVAGIAVLHILDRRELRQRGEE